MTKRPTFGSPDVARASTSHVERQNMTMRMHLRRMTRLCNGFSRKVENHRAAIALHFAWYNFCRVHEALCVTPAMEAGLTDHVWSVAEQFSVVLSEPPGEPPRAKPLRMPEPPAGQTAAPSRETITGRVLRLVKDAAAAALSMTSPAGWERKRKDDGQGPKPPEPPNHQRPVQLRLFDED